MSIEKHVSATWQIETVFDSPSKVAIWQPPTYIAPEIKAYMDRLRETGPDPRFTYVHIIAMTDGDYYGSNLNGDVFTTDELTGTQSPEEAAKNRDDMRGVPVPRYKTFEQAKFFRNHANGDRDPYYGDVPCAAWNDLMRRVELVIRVAKKAVPELGMQDGGDIVLKLDRRGYITVSMGTRISHEQCSICNHENEFIHERCSHLAEQMNDVLADGRSVHAKNFGMRFFDISDVGVPADPGAYSLAKVASVAAAAAAPNLAFDADGYAEWRTKHSEITKTIPCSDPVADLLPVFDPSRRTQDEPEAYPVEQLKQALFAADNNLDVVLSTAAAASIVFSPVELCTLTALAEPDKMATSSFRGFNTLSFDKVSRPVYDALRSKFAVRSGFVAPSYARGWEPAKLADEGNTVVADYYAFYRDALRSLSRSTFVKAAHRIPYIREVVDAGGDPKAAMVNLAYAGLSL